MDILKIIQTSPLNFNAIVIEMPTDCVSLADLNKSFCQTDETNQVLYNHAQPQGKSFTKSHV